MVTFSVTEKTILWKFSVPGSALVIVVSTPFPTDAVEKSAVQVTEFVGLNVPNTLCNCAV
jgi:hypothetical protein